MPSTATAIDKILKQRVGAVKHALRVELHTHQAAIMGFDGFDDAIWPIANSPQPGTDLVYSLNVIGVGNNFWRIQHLPDMRICRKLHGMVGCAASGTMEQHTRFLRVDIGVNRASCLCIDKLHPVANAEHGLIGDS